MGAERIIIQQKPGTDYQESNSPCLYWSFPKPPGHLCLDSMLHSCYIDAGCSASAPLGPKVRFSSSIGDSQNGNKDGQRKTFRQIFRQIAECAGMVHVSESFPAISWRTEVWRRNLRHPRHMKAVNMRTWRVSVSILPFKSLCFLIRRIFAAVLLLGIPPLGTSELGFQNLSLGISSRGNF